MALYVFKFSKFGHYIHYIMIFLKIDRRFDVKTGDNMVDH